MPNNNSSLNRKGTTAIKRTLIGKQLRSMLLPREQQENDAIVRRFKEALLSPQPTRAQLFSALKATANSTITKDLEEPLNNGEYKLLRFNADGTILVRSLPKPLRDAYREAEAIMRSELEKQIRADFDARNDYTPEEILGFNERLLSAQSPLKERFKINTANAA